MGIGRPPDYNPLLEHPDILTMAWGATVPMMAHAVGIELDEITTTWDKWVTGAPITTAKGVVEPGTVAAINFTINGVRPEVRPASTPARQPRGYRCRAGLAPGNRTTSTGSTSRAPSITQETAFRFTDGSGRAPAVAGCLATGLRALNASPR